MAKIVVSAEYSSVVKLKCFLNGEEICQVLPKEIKVIDVEKNIYKFELCLGGVWSDKLELDLINNDIAEIQGASGFFKTKISLAYKNGFVLTRRIRKGLYEFQIDEINNKWSIPRNILAGATDDEIYNFSDILDFEVKENGKTILSTTNGGLGKAIVGGAMFGGVGAVVGGMTANRKTISTVNNGSYQLIITVNDIKNPNKIFDIGNDEKTATEIVSLLQVMYNSKNNQKETNNINISIADEIKKFKELLDIGAITEEEYNKKKSELLNM